MVDVASGSALVMAADFPRRARRFDMRLPLRYRLGESAPWVNATTDNISASGLLFVADVVAGPVADHLEAPDTPVEMVLLMPTEILGNGGCRVMCQGRIVRTVAATEGGKAAMAATIASYEFVPGDNGGNDATGHL